MAQQAKSPPLYPPTALGQIVQQVLRTPKAERHVESRQRLP
jgi:hypothetical protein